MRHYWVLGLLGVGFYGIYQYSSGGLWFQSAQTAEISSVRAESGDFHWSGRLASGETIEIKGVNGAVEAQAARGNQVVVRASKRARRSDVNTVRLEVVEHGRGVTICAVYPSRRGKSGCEPGNGGSLGGGTNDVNVDFEIEVPGGITFVGQTVNGSVRAVDLDGPMEATTVNGGIELSGSGSVTAQTVNGDIDASLADTKLTGGVSLQTVNGTVRLELPSGINADIFGSTANGQIHSEFPLTVQGRFGPKQFEGVIGDGGDDIRLESVNGTISLVRRNR